MFDWIEGGAAEPAAGARALMVAADGASAARLTALCGDGVDVVAADRLSAGWPDYVAARARTAGALVVEDQRPEGFASLAEGALFDRPAEAGVVDGALVFVLGAAQPALAA